MAKPKLASEVLAGALEFWGAGGERWIAGELGQDDKACLVGGLSAGLIGYPQYYEDMCADGTDTTLYRQAMKYIHDELESRCYYKEPHVSVETLEARLIAFNDNLDRIFPEIKDVVCCALKRALAAEEKATRASIE